LLPAAGVLTLALATAISRPAFSASEEPPGKIRFNRDIRPVLSDNCFRCHGPDSAHRKADLRLDQREGLFAERNGITPVKPGKLQDSELYLRITADAASGIMPPPSSHKKLTSAHKELIRRWIEQGAPWEPHWSFLPPQRPALPVVKASAWVRNPIDYFVLATLEAQQLQPAPEADRRTLIRRMSFDLTGLPPPPAEVEAFVHDSAPDAYEKLVDRLLASSHYGEHRARYWLDAARYADTHGLHIDNYREMWPYRDWVIAAFNRNLPFDRFTVEQIAGDLLPGRTLDQQIASGFHRCNITTNEGGVIPEEVDAMYQKDRVETTATVWLGLTAGCASCHDHKFDPLSQREFYELVAFFKNTTQRPLDGNIHDTPPVIVVPRAADRERWLALRQESADLQARKQQRLEEAAAALSNWLQGPEAKAVAEPLDPADLHVRFPLDEGTGPAASARLPGKDTSLALDGELSWGQGPAEEKALHFGPKSFLELTDVGDFEAHEPFSVALWVYVPEAEDSFAVLSKANPKAKGAGHSWGLDIGNRIPIFKLAGDGTGDTITIRGNGSQRLRPGKWSHLVVSYDGSRTVGGLRLYVDGKPQPTAQTQGQSLKGSLRNPGSFRLGFDGRRGFKGGALYDVRVYRRVLQPEEASLVFRWNSLRRSLAKAPESLTPQDREDLRLLYAHRADELYRQTLARLSEVERHQQAIRQRGAVTHVMQEKPDAMARAHVLFRGQYDQPRDEVLPGVPAALHAFPADVPKNRLGLAQWLVDPANPLTARVTVNRFWQEVFGTGLVRTAEDFGIMGENPSHPELLDWLAVDFRESGWDVKRFLKLLVTSATYRQVSASTPEKLKKDPSNRLLSRGPRFRHDAETLRDFALAASGLLVRKVGGPSVKPYQPPGIWETVAMYSSNTRFYKPDAGENLYRRSLYTFWKRSAPPASMEILNAPSRENCSVRRERTNTPLQALVTLNDPQFVEAARHLAQRALLEAPADEPRRLDFLSMHLLARPFDAQEREVCSRALHDFLAHYGSRQEEARKLIETGDSKPDPRLAAVELAAWTMLASQVMNLDEALNK
jgi:hypothetical protein